MAGTTATSCAQQIRDRKIHQIRKEKRGCFSFSSSLHLEGGKRMDDESARRSVSAPPKPQWKDADPTAASTRFQIELEFVQCLSNPYYLQCASLVQLVA